VATDSTGPSGGDQVRSVLGPLATVGLVALGCAGAKRSAVAFGIAIAAFALETRWSAYQRFKRDPRFRGLNLMTVFDDPPAAGSID
jgi:hypothetical protein